MNARWVHLTGLMRERSPTVVKIESVCVFCGASPGNRPAYSDAASKLGTVLAAKGIRLVYGGSGIGTMLELADAALSAGGSVTGVIPRILVDREQAHSKLTQLHIVDSLDERKAKMAELSDAFIALPGGLGTLDGILEMLTWSQLGLQRKPCGFLNVDGYYARLFEFFDTARDEGFLRADYRDSTMVADDVEDLLRQFEHAGS